MGEETCVCGHKKSDHQEIDGMPGLVCMHEEEDGTIDCGCVEFEAAEKAGA